MANEKNLIPGAHKLTVEEQSAGGKKSGESRRRKRSMKSAAKLMLGLSAADETALEKLRNMGLAEEDLTNQMLVIAAMFQAAAEGDVRAAVFLRDTVGESPAAELQREERRAENRERRDGKAVRRDDPLSQSLMELAGGLASDPVPGAASDGEGGGDHAD